MNEYPLDDVHRLLDGLDSLLVKLRSSQVERLKVENLPEIIEAVHELGGWRNTQYLSKQVGITGSLLNQFMQLKGSVRRADALQIADRLRNHLRSLDQLSQGPPEGEAMRAEVRSPRSRAQGEVGFLGERWVAIGSVGPAKMKIAAISSLLDSIVEQIKHSNASPHDQLLTDIERQQLIAILETALHVLRAPLVEKGLLKNAEVVLKKGAQSAAEKGVQQGLGKLMDGTAARIMELIGSLFG